MDLGWDSNALEMREFSPDTDGHTWEEWEETVQEMHPVRFFFAETLADFIRYKVWFPIKRPFVDAHYWFVSHFIPSRRYHMLDLRQPMEKGALINHDIYRYGWRDVPEKMLYAWFNLLAEYMKEEPYDLTNDYTMEQINADLGMKRQHESLQEVKDILHWWQVERKQEYKTLSDIRGQWYKAHKDATARAKGTDEKLYVVMHNAEKDIETKTDEMLTRVMKIRRSLWT